MTKKNEKKGFLEKYINERRAQKGSPLISTGFFLDQKTSSKKDTLDSFFGNIFSWVIEFLLFILNFFLVSFVFFIDFCYKFFTSLYERLSFIFLKNKKIKNDALFNNLTVGNFPFLLKTEPFLVVDDLSKIPKDFILKNPYYSFLKALNERETPVPAGQGHFHHVIPRHCFNKALYSFSVDSPINLIYVYPEEHISLHALRYFVFGQKGDRAAVFLLTAKKPAAVIQKAEQLYQTEVLKYLRYTKVL